MLNLCEKPPDRNGSSCRTVKSRGAVFGKPRPSKQTLRKLKLEACAELDLPLTEKESVGKIARRCESRIERGKHAGTKRTGSGRPRAGAQVIHPVVDARQLGAIEDIETFSKQFEFGVLF